MQLNGEGVDWAGEDITYLQPAVWAEEFRAAVAAAKAVGTLEAFFAAACAAGGEAPGVKYAYGSVEAYPAVAHRFNYIDDAKAGVPRTAYEGVVTFVHNGCRKFAVPGGGAR